MIYYKATKKELLIIVIYYERMEYYSIESHSTKFYYLTERLMYIFIITISIFDFSVLAKSSKNMFTGIKVAE